LKAEKKTTDKYIS